jgi:hypothetical protein
MRRDLLDGYLVHTAALSRGLDVTLLPRQLLMVSAPGTDREISFIHGVPESSTLAAVTFAHDKRMRRALLVDAGLPIPKGGSYSIGRGVESAQRLIRRTGYPLVVKPANGDNTIEVHRGIGGETELRSAVDYFWTPPHERPDYIRAAYGLTDSRDLEERDGRLVTPGGTRVLIEQEVKGVYLRFILIGGEAESVLSVSGDPWDGHVREVTGDVHTSLVDVAARAARAVPGLAVAVVDVVVSDGPARAVSDQDVWVVELSERPWLEVAATASSALAPKLADAIVGHHADRMSVPVGDASDWVRVSLEVDGVAAPEATAAAVNAAAAQRAVDGELAVRDAINGTLFGELAGAPADIAWITENLLAGELDGERAMFVAARHRDEDDR